MGSVAVPTRPDAAVKRQWPAPAGATGRQAFHLEGPPPPAGTPRACRVAALTELEPHLEPCHRSAGTTPDRLLAGDGMEQADRSDTFIYVWCNEADCVAENAWDDHVVVGEGHGEIGYDVSVQGRCLYHEMASPRSLRVSPALAQDAARDLRPLRVTAPAGPACSAGVRKFSPMPVLFRLVHPSARGLKRSLPRPSPPC